MPPRIRAQINAGVIPVQFASVMLADLEAQHERQEKIDAAASHV